VPRTIGWSACSRTGDWLSATRRLAGRAGSTSPTHRRRDGEYRWMKPRECLAGGNGNCWATWAPPSTSELQTGRASAARRGPCQNRFSRCWRTSCATARSAAQRRAFARRPNQNRQLLEALRLMDRQIQTLARLIDDLLDVSRITQGKPRSGQTAELALSAGPSRPRARKSNHGQTLSFAPSEPCMQADPVRLTRCSATCSPTPASSPRNRISAAPGNRA
jgi:hypothetical protein